MSVRRSTRVLVLLTGLVTATAGTVVAPASAHNAHSTRFPTRIELPNGWQPEGISIKGTTAYFGSRADGDIYAADLRTGRGRVIAQGPGTASIGVKIDRSGLLYVAGGNAGTGRVVDTRTGEQIRNYQFTTATSFVNDEVITPRAVWFTDSRQPQLYRVALDRHGRPVTSFSTLPLSGDYQHVPNVNNANGISRTPDGKALIIVQSATGFLFRVDPRTGHTTRIDLGGVLMTNGDGLLLLGRTLYVVQNQLNRIAVLRLNSSGTVGRQVDTITSTDFDIPTTAAAFGNRLYLPNARFSTPATPDTPFWVTAVRR